MAKSKFADMTIDYKQLLKMTVSDRVSLMGSSSGQGIMQSLTATQYASLFPTYYKDRGRLPDYSGFQKAMTPEGAARISTSPTIEAGTASRVKGTAAQTALQRTTPAAIERLAKKTGVNISDTGSRARLTAEERSILKKMRDGQFVGTDDENATFISKLSAEDKQKFGIIDSVDESGKQVYKMSATEVTKEEIDTARKSTVNGGSNKEIIMKSFAAELRKQGVPEANLSYAVASLAGQVQQESGFNPKASHDKDTGYGIYGARDPSPGRGRKTDMLKWLDSNGYSKDSPEGQARYMVHEAFMKYPKTADALRNASKDNIASVTATLVNDFERPQERVNNIKIRTQNSMASLETAAQLSQDIDLSSGMTDEQIAELVKKKKEASAEEQIAAKLYEKAPAGLDPKLVEAFNRMNPGQKQNFIEALKKDGGGTDDPTASGVAKLNESFNSDPKATQESIERNVSPGGNVRFSDKGVEARASGLADATKLAYEKLKVFGPPNSVVTSTYRGREHPIEADKIRRGLAPGSHSRGEAVDVQTRDKSPEEIAAMIQALKKSGFNNVLLEGNPPHIHAEVRPGQTEFTVSNLGRGNPSISLEAARTAAASAEYNVALNEEQEKKKQEILAAEKAAADAKPVAKRTLSNFGPGYAGFKPGPGSPGSTSTEQTPINTVTPTAPQQAASVEQAPAPVQTASVEPAAAPEQAASAEPTATPVQTASAEQVPVPVQAFADGGEAAVNDGEISAQPINAMKGDNSLVVDGNKNPLFTMNTKEESANYDPESGKVSVEPVSKNNPDSLKAPDSPDSAPAGPTQAERSGENNGNISSINSAKASEPNYSMDAATRLTTTAPCPSFGRAMSAAQFGKSGSHFDAGAIGLK
jgi:hypothetical protein